MRGLAPFFLIGILFLAGCADERPLKPILKNSARIARKELKGDFYFLKSVVEVRSPGAKFAQLLPGAYLKTNNVVRFELKERSLDIVSQVKGMQNSRPSEKPPILATFITRDVDVLRKQNVDGQDTNEEEETESRRVWNEREFVVIDGATDSQDEFKTDTLSARMENILVEAGSLRFDVVRQLNDGTLAKERYHFLAKRPSSYTAHPYPVAIQQRFGFFKTTVPGFDNYQQVSVYENQEWMNLRSLQDPVRYSIDPSFPDHLKGGVRTALDQWNLAFKQSTGKTPLVPVFETTAEKRGDLRYNVIVYEDSPDSGHGILGYAPTFSDPTSGEMINGSVVVYGGTLGWARLAEESWRKTKEYHSAEPAGPEPTPVAGKAPLELPALTEFLKPHRDLLLGNPRLEREDLAVMVRKFAQPAKLLENTRAAFQGELHERLTYWEAGMPVIEGADNPVALEQKIFPPLIAHELGHTLGLRHNFKGSADHRHITRGKSSTVMDYGFLASEETQEIGQYDYAAIEIAYGNRKAEQKRLKAENFLFCTDENIYNSRDGLCLPYDSGSNLQEVVETLFRRYVGSYHFLNLRLDRVYFDENIENYIKKIGSLLFPIRQLYDHAAAIVSAAETRADHEVAIWRLAGARVEADSNSSPDDVKEFGAVRVTKPDRDPKTPAKEQVFAATLLLDKTKLKFVVADAKKAKRRAAKILFQIVFKREFGAEEPGIHKALASRSDLDISDDSTDALWQRGILADRLMALSLLLSPSADPLGMTTQKSVATTYSEGLPPEQKDEFTSRLTSVMANAYFDTSLAQVRWRPLVPPLPNVLRRSVAAWTAKDLGYYSEGSLRAFGMISRQAAPLPFLGDNDFNLFGFLVSPRRPKMENALKMKESRENSIQTLADLTKDQDKLIQSVADLIRFKGLARADEKGTDKEREAIQRAKERELIHQLYSLESVLYGAESVSIPIAGTRDYYRAFHDRFTYSAPKVDALTHIFRAEMYRQVHRKILALSVADLEREEKRPEIERDGIILTQAKINIEGSSAEIEKLERYLVAERLLLEFYYDTFSDTPKHKE